VRRQCHPEDAKEVDQERWDLALSLAAAVGAMHAKGVLHKDLKMANCMVEGEGAQRRVRVVDLGLSRLIGPAGMCVDMGGTLEYLPPEVSGLA
jgi:serine/threonine protein kinase